MVRMALLRQERHRDSRQDMGLLPLRLSGGNSEVFTISNVPQGMTAAVGSLPCCSAIETGEWEYTDAAKITNHRRGFASPQTHRDAEAERISVSHARAVGKASHRAFLRPPLPCRLRRRAPSR